MLFSFHFWTGKITWNHGCPLKTKTPVPNQHLSKRYPTTVFNLFLLQFLAKFLIFEHVTHCKDHCHAFGLWQAWNNVDYSVSWHFCIPHCCWQEKLEGNEHLFQIGRRLQKSSTWSHQNWFNVEAIASLHATLVMKVFSVSFSGIFEFLLSVLFSNPFFKALTGLGPWVLKKQAKGSRGKLICLTVWK